MPTFFANKRNKCLLKQASSADYRICIYKVGGKVASRNAENRILILYAFADSCICIRFVQQRSELDRLFTCLYLEHHRYLLFVTELETERTGLAATRYNYTSVLFRLGCWELNCRCQSPQSNATASFVRILIYTLHMIVSLLIKHTE